MIAAVGLAHNGQLATSLSLFHYEYISVTKHSEACGLSSLECWAKISILWLFDGVSARKESLLGEITFLIT